MKQPPWLMGGSELMGGGWGGVTEMDSGSLDPCGDDFKAKPLGMALCLLWPQDSTWPHSEVCKRQRLENGQKSPSRCREDLQKDNRSGRRGSQCSDTEMRRQRLLPCRFLMQNLQLRYIHIKLSPIPLIRKKKSTDFTKQTFAVKTMKIEFFYFPDSTVHIPPAPL